MAGRVARDPISGELVDPDTGEVLEEHPVDRGPEWREYTEEERVRRRRAEPIHASLPGMGLGSIREEDPRVRAVLAALRRLAARVPSGRSLMDRAAAIARRAVGSKVLCASPRVLAAAAMVIAARERGIPLAPRDVAGPRDASGVFSCMARLATAGVASAPPPDPRSILFRIAEEAMLPGESALLAARIIDAAARAGVLRGRRRATVAAAALYIASRLLGAPDTLRSIARAAGVSTKTVSQAYKDLVASLEIEVLL